MPRKTPVSRVWHAGHTMCFNEAAARCRGKRPEKARLESPDYQASMRPRPDAAENSRLADRRRHALRASMRPRPDAAENVMEGGDRWRRYIMLQ